MCAASRRSVAPLWSPADQRDRHHSAATETCVVAAPSFAPARVVAIVAGGERESSASTREPRRARSHSRYSSAALRKRDRAARSRMATSAPDRLQDRGSRVERACAHRGCVPRSAARTVDLDLCCSMPAGTVEPRRMSSKCTAVRTSRTARVLLRVSTVGRLGLRRRVRQSAGQPELRRSLRHGDSRRLGRQRRRRRAELLDAAERPATSIAPASGSPAGRTAGS